MYSEYSTLYKSKVFHSFNEECVSDVCVPSEHGMHLFMNLCKAQRTAGKSVINFHFSPKPAVSVEFLVQKNMWKKIHEQSLLQHGLWNLERFQMKQRSNQLAQLLQCEKRVCGPRLHLKLRQECGKPSCVVWKCQNVRFCSKRLMQKNGVLNKKVKPFYFNFSSFLQRKFRQRKGPVGKTCISL